MQPVPMPAITKGMDARVSLYEHRAALVKSNRRLGASRNWYGGVRSGYAGKPK